MTFCKSGLFIYVCSPDKKFNFIAFFIILPFQFSLLQEVLIRLNFINILLISLKNVEMGSPTDDGDNLIYPQAYMRHLLSINIATRYDTLER
jgi:hypothetical protein